METWARDTYLSSRDVPQRVNADPLHTRLRTT